MLTQQWIQHSKRQHSTTFTVTYAYHDRISTTLASTSSIPGQQHDRYTHLLRLQYNTARTTASASTYDYSADATWMTPEPTPTRVAARYIQPPHCRTHHRHLQDQLGTTSPTSSIDAAAATEPFDKHAPQQHSAVLRTISSRTHHSIKRTVSSLTSRIDTTPTTLLTLTRSSTDQVTRGSVKTLTKATTTSTRSPDLASTTLTSKQSIIWESLTTSIDAVKTQDQPDASG